MIFKIEQIKKCLRVGVIFTSTSFFISTFLFAQESEVSRIEREAELIDFQSIREILQEDNLTEEADQKVEKVKEVKQERVDQTRERYNVPSEREFWSIFSEYWLIKNATVLKWDFQKPDYGIEESFKEFLEDFGHYEITFRILLMDSPNIPHTYLPAGKDEYIFLLSVPFIRAMDLSRQEISILLYENFLRARSQFFEKKVTTEELKNIWGGNFHGEKFNEELFKKLERKYDRVLFEEGFTFQEQFEVTKEMDNLFRGREKIWDAYYRLIQKIDELVKTNFLYSQYPQIYPSPELQMGWLRPKRDRGF